MVQLIRCCKIGLVFWGLVILVSPASARNSNQELQCRNGSAEACNAVGLDYERLGRRAQAASYFEQACEGGVAVGCSNRAEYYFDSAGADPRNLVKAAEGFKAACDAGVPSGCGGLCLTVFTAAQNFTPEMVEACTKVLNQACQAGNSWMCNKIPITPTALRQDTRPLHETKCRQGSAEDCNHLGVALTALNDQAAGSYLQRACRLGYQMGCSNYGETLFDQRRYAEALKMFEGACDAGVDSGCAGKCLTLHTQGRLAAASLDTCDKYVKQACTENFWMCSRGQTFEALVHARQAQQADNLGGLCPDAAVRDLGRAYWLATGLADQVFTFTVTQQSQLVRYVRANSNHFRQGGPVTRCASALGALLTQSGLEGLDPHARDRAVERFGNVGPPGMAQEVGDSLNSGALNAFGMGQELLWLAEVLPALAQGDLGPFNTTGTFTRQQLRQVGPLFQALGQQDPFIHQLLGQLSVTMGPIVEQQIKLLALMIQR